MTRTRRPRVSPSMTVTDAFDAAVGTAGRTWISADGDAATLEELSSGADRVAEDLRRGGVGKGDHVALLLPNGVRYVEAFIGVLRAGGVVVPLDPGLSPSELGAAHAAVPLAAVLADRPLPESGAPLATWQGSRWRLPEAAHASPAPPAHRADPAAVFFTTGTTGDPKPVHLSHHDLIRPLVALQRLHEAFFSGSVTQTARRVATLAQRHGTRLLRATGGQTWLTLSPFRSIAGHQVLFGSLLLGHNLVTSRSFHPRRTLELVAAHQVNVLAGTPAVVELLLRVPDDGSLDLSSLLVIGVGGGPASPELVERARQRFGCAVTVGYGSTELGGGVLATRLEDALETQSQTVGRAFPGTEVRVVGEDGQECPPGSPGELQCRRTDTGQGGWTRTGDLAVVDEQGNVRILGRQDDLVVRGGQNVHPAEVERVVEQLPGVDRCGVTGVPARGDQQVWAFVTARAGTRVTVQEVRQHCRLHLASYKQPDKVRVVDELPTAESGEVRRHVLRDQAVAELTAAEEDRQ